MESMYIAHNNDMIIFNKIYNYCKVPVQYKCTNLKSSLTSSPLQI